MMILLTRIQKNDINELIYDLTDLEIKEYCEDGRDRKEQPSYKELLLK